MIKFSERPLTSLDIYHRENNEVVIAVSDASGHIRFLSPDMKILFWLKRTALSGLCAISFTEHELEILGHDAEGQESTVDKVRRLSMKSVPYYLSFSPNLHRHPYVR